MESKAVRIGIDVGGTFTHAVAIDHRTLTIVAKACRPTTHRAADGVAEGIWQCLEDLLAGGAFAAEDVVFVAHSTTQATNALLEGDVAAVALIGLVEGVTGAQAKRELSFDEVKITGDKSIPVRPVFFAPGDAEAGVKAFLKNPGGPAEAFVVAEPFAVDNPDAEKRIGAVISDAGFPVTASHEVSGLYGLRARARTSVVNAAILPKMMDVAKKTRIAVDRLSLKPALMIMRSDGGVMTAAGMARTPILTILSGPAAGVSAAILYEKIANGFFVEVGGTSTDISLIINGKPQRKQAVIGGNILYLKTLDVRTIGAAGGSMIRASKGKIIDAGPRSAHIAGLNYSCFTGPSAWTNPSIRFVSPREGDPSDYVVADTGSGETCALTTTCAANALGLLPDGDYSQGNHESARRAFEALAKALNADADAIARETLRIASEKIAQVCRELLKEYPIEGAALTMIGGGGGASVVVPGAAELAKLPYKRARDAEVISAVGVGMALMKNVIEKSVVDPKEEDIKAIRSEVIRSLIESGADPDTIEIEIEVDKQKNIVRGTATGTSALVSMRQDEEIGEEEAMKVAAASLGASDGIRFEIAFEDASCRVISGVAESRGFLGLAKKTKHPVVVVDRHGLAKLTLQDAEIISAPRDEAAETLSKAVSRATTFGDGGAILKTTYLVFAGKVIELSKVGDPEKMLKFAELEISEHPKVESFCLIFKK
jgi:N-methylhydantoinase A/oxoprolinase/acetone carboxylase beta subunit